MSLALISVVLSICNNNSYTSQIKPKNIFLSNVSIPLPAPHISINDRSRTLIASQFASHEFQTSVLRTKTTIKSITQVRLLDFSFRTMLLALKLFGLEGIMMIQRNPELCTGGLESGRFYFELRIFVFEDI